jgi:hypothetical protein
MGFVDLKSVGRTSTTVGCPWHPSRRKGVDGSKFEPEAIDDQTV